MIKSGRRTFVAVLETEEVAVQALIVIKFGMEGKGDLSALLGSNNVVACGGQDAAGRLHLFYIWCANERHRDVWPHAIYWLHGVETAQLPPVGIAAHANVHGAEVQGREQDEPCTGAEDWQTGKNVAADGLKQTKIVEQARLRGGLTTWQHQPILRLLPVGKLAHLEGFCTQLAEYLLMLNECSLKS